jgi:hypothetical protein
VVSPVADLDGLPVSSDSEDDKDNARCNRLRKFCRRGVCETFRIPPILASEVRRGDEWS